MEVIVGFEIISNVMLPIIGIVFLSSRSRSTLVAEIVDDDGLQFFIVESSYCIKNFKKRSRRRRKPFFLQQYNIEMLQYKKLIMLKGQMIVIVNGE